MSDIELAIKSSKQIEEALERIYGAQGRGLHEKLTSVESLIPLETAKKIRYVASVRNSLVHEPDSDTIRDRARFEDIVRQILSGLTRAKSPPKSDFTHVFGNEAFNMFDRSESPPQTDPTTQPIQNESRSSWIVYLLTIVSVLALVAGCIFLAVLGLRWAGDHILGISVFGFIILWLWVKK